MSESQLFFPCKHAGTINWDCNCLPRQLEWNNLFEIHFKQFCTREDHKHLKEDGFLKIKKPFWKNCCRVPFQDVFWQEQLEKLCQYLKLDCSCGYGKRCKLCSYLIGESSISYDPLLPVSDKENWNLKHIGLLLPLLKFPEV